MINVGESKNSKNHQICKKDYTWNPITCVCEDGEYLENVIDE